MSNSSHPLSRAALPLIALLSLVASCEKSEEAASDASVRWPSAAEANAAIGKGVQIVSPCCGTQRGVPGAPTSMKVHAAAAASKGFTGVRYAVWLAPEYVDGAVDQSDPAWLDDWLDKIEAEVEVLLEHDMVVVINYNQNLNGDMTGDRLAERWRKVAERFRNMPTKVYFEILNEPNLNGGFDLANRIDATAWNRIVAKVIPVIRVSNPERIIVVSSALWSLPQAIPDLELPADDKHLIATFHNYLPLQFTHQDALGDFSKPWIGTTWTGTDQEVAAMKATMNDAVCWSRRTGVPLFVGEFSPYNAGRFTDQNPMLWLKTIVQLMEAEDISWTYFHLHGLVDPKTKRISFDLLWNEEANVWNQPVLDTLDEARAEKVKPWVECSGE